MYTPRFGLAPNSSVAVRESASRLLPKYDIKREIGEGASGTVYLVTEKATQRDFVLKSISLMGLSEEERAQSEHEVSTLKAVDHPNVVEFHESEMTPSTCRIVMERCETTLEILIAGLESLVGGDEENDDNGVDDKGTSPKKKKSTPPPSEQQGFPEGILIEWMAELLSAMLYLHKRGIVHRDIKTGNIFVSKKNHLKLGDFGVCTVSPLSASRGSHNVSGADKSSSGAAAASSEQTFSFVGTPFYVAPEVCHGEPWTPLSDVWSLGVVLYELCTLKRPFNGNHVLSVVREILEKPIEPFPPGKLKDSRFELVVMAMLDRDPKRRPSVSQLLQKFFVLPASHPSHPDMLTSRARQVQRGHGPALPQTILDAAKAIADEAYPTNSSPFAPLSTTDLENSPGGTFTQTRHRFDPREIASMNRLDITHSSTSPIRGGASSLAIAAPAGAFSGTALSGPSSPLHAQPVQRPRRSASKSASPLSAAQQLHKDPYALEGRPLSSSQDRTDGVDTEQLNATTLSTTSTLAATGEPRRIAPPSILIEVERKAKPAAKRCTPASKVVVPFAARPQVRTPLHKPKMNPAAIKNPFVPVREMVPALADKQQYQQIHSETYLQRIRSVKSTVDMSDLRKRMKERHKELAAVGDMVHVPIPRAYRGIVKPGVHNDIVHVDPYQQELDDYPNDAAPKPSTDDVDDVQLRRNGSRGGIAFDVNLSDSSPKRKSAVPNRHPPSRPSIISDSHDEELMQAVNSMKDSDGGDRGGYRQDHAHFIPTPEGFVRDGVARRQSSMTSSVDDDDDPTPNGSVEDLLASRDVPRIGDPSDDDDSPTLSHSSPARGLQTTRAGGRGPREQIEELLRQHSRSLTLEDFDDIAVELNRIKVQRFGMC